MAGAQAWLVGLAVASTVLAYPLFNQVKDTSLRALEDAGHGGTVDDLPKFLRDRDGDGWPDDEQLEYWNGRLPEGEEYGPDGDMDGDGVPNRDDDDADGDGVSNGDEVRVGGDPGQWEDYGNGSEPPENVTDDGARRVRESLWEYDARDEDEPRVLSRRHDFTVRGYETLEVTVNVTDYQGNLALGVETPGGTPHQRTVTLQDSAGDPQDRRETFTILSDDGTWTGFVDGNSLDYAQVAIQVHGIKFVEEET